MTHRIEAVATMVILTGFLLFSAVETALLGGLLVVGGVYALVLPRLVGPHGPATR